MKEEENTKQNKKKQGWNGIYEPPHKTLSTPALDGRTYILSVHIFVILRCGFFE